MKANKEFIAAIVIVSVVVVTLLVIGTVATMKSSVMVPLICWGALILIFTQTLNRISNLLDPEEEPG